MGNIPFLTQAELALENLNDGSIVAAAIQCCLFVNPFEGRCPGLILAETHATSERWNGVQK